MDLSLEGLVKEIKSKAAKEAKKIESDTAQANEILAKAKGEKAEILAKAKTDAERLIEAERNEKLASARLRGKRLVASARETALENSLTLVLKELKAITKTPKYKALLKALVKEAEKELEGKTVVLSSSSDRSAAGASKTIETMGGVMVQTTDGRVSVNNTFEARFESARESVRREIYSQLFGKE